MVQITRYPLNADSNPMDLLTAVLVDATGNGGARLLDPPRGPDGNPVDTIGLVMIDSTGTILDVAVASEAVPTSGTYRPGTYAINNGMTSITDPIGWFTVAGGTPGTWVPVYANAASFALDADGALAANSDARVATQKAVRTYVATAVTGLLDFKGSTNASSNPDYPAASKGDAYVINAAGRIGGASGKIVEVGDVYFATNDNAGGTEAAVGANWAVLEHNLQGALLAANNLSDVASASSARTNLGLKTGALVNIAVGTSAPGSPATNDLWVDTN